MDKIRYYISVSFQTLSSLKARLFFAIGMSLFGIVFLYLFQPFNISEWISYTTPFQRMTLSGLALICTLVIFSSQLIQWYIWKSKDLKVYHLLIGFVLDVFNLSIPLSILYAVPENKYIVELLQTLCVVTPIVVLWYTLGLSIMGIIESRKLLMQTEKHSAVAAAEEENHDAQNDSMIKITDDNGQLRLLLSRENLLFIESADNYIIVYFRKGERVSKEIIRNSLKNVENDLSKMGCIRCHRSYLVSISSVLCFRKSGRSYVFEMKWIQKTIPISRGYVSLIKDMFD